MSFGDGECDPNGVVMWNRRLRWWYVVMAMVTERIPHRAKVRASISK